MKVFFWFYNVVLLLTISVMFNNYSIMFVGLTGMIILYVCLRDYKDIKYKDLIVTITVAFIFMLLLYVGLCEKFGEPYYAHDDKAFEFYGHQLYGKNIFRFKDIPYIDGMYYAKGYLVIISWIDQISSALDGYSTISPRVLNIYLWLSTVVLTSKQISASVDDKSLARKAFIILALFPNALYISSFVYRDTFIVFLIVASIYNFEKLVKAIKTRNMTVKNVLRIPLILFCLNALYYSRVQMLYVVMLICFALFFEERLKAWSSYKVIAVVAAAAVGLVLLQLTGGVAMMSGMTSGYSSYLSGLSEGLSGMVFSRSLLPFGIFLRFFYGLVCPFPAALISLGYFEEPIYSLVIALTCFGTIFQIFLLPYLFKGMIKLDYISVKFLGIFAAIIVTTFTFRHFLMAYPFAAHVVAQQLEHTECKTRKKYTVYIGVFISLAAVSYLLLKVM